MFANYYHILAHRFYNGYDAVHIFEYLIICFGLVFQIKAQPGHTVYHFFYIFLAADILNNISRQLRIFPHKKSPIFLFSKCARAMSPPLVTRKRKERHILF